MIPVFPETPGKHKDIIAQTDGGMVPIVVEPDPDAEGQAQRQDAVVERGQDFHGARQREHNASVYAGAIEGGVETAGRQLSRMRGSGRLRREFPRSCGRGRERHGSWAKWRSSLACRGSYLIDFYHVCEYLSNAAKAIAANDAAQKAWMEAQKDALKTGRLDKTLQSPRSSFRIGRSGRRPGSSRAAMPSLFPIWSPKSAELPRSLLAEA